MCRINYEYVNRGSVNTFVFIHGWGLSGDCFNDIISRINNISYVKLDLFGFGKSSEPKDYFDTYEYAYQIFLLIKKLSLKNIVLVGHSFGGRISILLSSVFGVNLTKLVLTASAGINRFSLVRYLRVRVYKFLKLLVCAEVCNSSILNLFGSDDFKNANDLMKGILKNVVVQDLRFCLRYICVKTMLVWDKKDVDTGYWICRKLNLKIDGSEVYLFGCGGHFVVFYNINKFVVLLLKNVC